MASSSLSLFVQFWFCFFYLVLSSCSLGSFVCPEPINHWIACEFSCLLGRIIDHCSALGCRNPACFLPWAPSPSGPAASAPGLMGGAGGPPPHLPVCVHLSSRPLSTHSRVPLLPTLAFVPQSLCL